MMNAQLALSSGSGAVAADGTGDQGNVERQGGGDGQGILALGQQRCFPHGCVAKGSGRDGADHRSPAACKRVKACGLQSSRSRRSRSYRSQSNKRESKMRRLSAFSLGADAGA